MSYNQAMLITNLNSFFSVYITLANEITAMYYTSRGIIVLCVFCQI